MEKTAEMTEILRELRQRLNSLYGENLRQLILYGSHDYLKRNTPLLLNIRREGVPV